MVFVGWHYLVDDFVILEPSKRSTTLPGWRIPSRTKKKS
ncbi:hypothetical protein B932_0065 [Gluconobacter oxydans H24]|nr:hypothetical protein B932_0065 [Gluconobacter oxydans H24]